MAYPLLSVAALMTLLRVFSIGLLCATGCTFNPGGLPDDPGIGGGGSDGDDAGTLPTSDGAPALDAQLTLDQTALDFGDLLVGQTSAPMLLTITNSGGQKSGVPMLSLDGPGAAHFSATSDCPALAPGASCHVTVLFKPTLAVSANALIGISATAGGAVSAAVSGRGLSPDNLVITPPSQDFGHANVGDAGDDHPFTVKNTGMSKSVALPVAQLGGTRPTAFTILSDDCAGHTLAAGKTCTISVQLTPDHSGALSALIQVGVLASTLTGTGDGHVWNDESTGSSARLSSVWGVSGKVWAVGASGGILRSSGDGTWTPLTSPTTNLLWWVTGSGSDVYAFGQNGTIARATNGGAFALDPVTTATKSLFGGWADASGAVAVGESGQIWGYVATGGGGAWQPQTSNTINVLNGAWGSAMSNLFAVGGVGTIVHLTNGAWTVEKSNTTNSLRGVWGSSATDVFAVGRSGTILHSTGSGTWTSMTCPISTDLWSVWGSGANDVYAVGDGGVLLHYDGTWSTVTLAATADLFGVWGSSAGDVYVVGDLGTILHYE